MKGREGNTERLSVTFLYSHKIISDPCAGVEVKQYSRVKVLKTTNYHT